MADVLDAIENFTYLPSRRYKEGRYPENMEKFNIVNTSPFESEVSFCFQNDANATTYLLDPPNMKLKPGEAQVRLGIEF